MRDTLSQITICIPTLPHRVDFLNRCVKWHTDRGIEALSLGDPSQTSFEAALTMFRQVKTPYATFLGDDDLLIPDGVAAAIRFLDSHPHHEVAHGKALKFGTADDAVYGRVEYVAPWKQIECDLGDSVRRVMYHLLHFHPTFSSVHRTETLIQAYAWAAELGVKLDNFGLSVPKHLEMNAYFSEIATSAIPLFYGRSKLLPELYYLRQVHSRSVSRGGTHTERTQLPFRSNLLRRAQFTYRAWPHYSELMEAVRFIERRP